MRTQLTWAHQDGIGFFLFDWYRENVDPCLDIALQNYKSLSDHHGVGFALLLVHNDVFAISPQEWPAFAERWVTEDFLNPDYERVDGKPLFVILDTTLFRQPRPPAPAAPLHRPVSADFGCSRVPRGGQRYRRPHVGANLACGGVREYPAKR